MRAGLPVGQVRNRFPTARELNSKLREWFSPVDSRICARINFERLTGQRISAARAVRLLSAFHVTRAFQISDQVIFRNGLTGANRFCGGVNSGRPREYVAFEQIVNAS